MFETLIRDSLVSAPAMGWAVLGVALVCLQILWRNILVSYLVTLFGLGGLMAFSLFTFDPTMNLQAFHGMVKFDPLFQLLNIIGLGVAFGVAYLMRPGLSNPTLLFRQSYEQLPEFLICLVFSGFGFSVLISAGDLTALFLGLETLSIGAYCMCGFFRTEIQSTESAIKYLLVGAFSAVIFLYGIAFVYGATGETGYAAIASKLSGGGFNPLLFLGILFMLAGFAFKLTFVPFHLYAADVYEGAPTPVTAYLATLVKVGALGAATRILWEVLPNSVSLWQPLWMGLCGLSILIGNLGALRQRTLKRLLAFSGISHAGFMGLGVAVASPGEGSLFPFVVYAVVYSAMSLGIFGLVSILEDRSRPLEIDDLKGMGQRRVAMGLLLSIFVLGLAGLPPFAGFMVKLWILQSLIEHQFTGMAIIAVFGSLIGAAYYLKILMNLYMAEPDETTTARSWFSQQIQWSPMQWMIALCAILTVLGGLAPQFYADWIFSSLALK